MARTFGISFESVRGAGPGRDNYFAGYLRRLDGLQVRGRDMHPAFEQIRKSFYAGERGIFASQGGGKWQPLTAKYLQRKVRAGHDPRIERRTGQVAAALMSGRGSGAVTEIGANDMVLGTNLKQAIFAQRGHGRKRRRLITLGKARANRWMKIIRNHLLEGPGGSGG